MGPDNNPTAFPGCWDDCPANMVSWFDALNFANLTSRAAGYEPCYRLSCRGQPGIDLFCTDVRFVGPDCDGYRLPTEAEWEYATRAENYGSFPGKSWNEIAWYYGNSRSRTHPVGRKAANRWGLRDVLGNLWEWVWDEYRRYSQGPATDPLQPFVSPRAARVFRGGSFGFWSEGDDLQIRFCRSASRYQGLPEERYPYVGFRLARTHR